MKRNDEKLNEKLIGKYKHVAFSFSLLNSYGKRSCGFSIFD